jgi:hypothetical protein
MKLLKIAGVLAALAFSVAATPASALTWFLNSSVAQSGLPAPYAQVDVTQGVNSLNFTVTLFDGLKFVDTGAHQAFAWNLTAGAPAITLGTAPAGFALVSSPNGIDMSPYLAFDYGLSCNEPACGNGGSGAFTGPLIFTINGTGLTLAMLDVTAQGNRFAADTLAVGGATGTISGGTPGTVPETATWAMMIIGFGMVGMGLRLRRREEPTLA